MDSKVKTQHFRELARMESDGFFDIPKSSGQIRDELRRRQCFVDGQTVRLRCDQADEFLLNVGTPMFNLWQSARKEEAHAAREKIVEERLEARSQNWKGEADRIHRLILSQPGKWPAYGEEDTKFLAMSLGGEAGEVLNEVKKWMRGDYTHEEFRNKVRAELADVQIILWLLARSLALSLNIECEIKLVEVAQRWEVGGKVECPCCVNPKDPEAADCTCIPGCPNA